MASLSNTELLEICQKWAQKKQQIFFGLTAKNDFDSYIFFLDILILLNGRCIIVVNAGTHDFDIHIEGLVQNGVIK